MINLARQIPHSLKERLNRTIEKYVECGVLVKVDQPTDWVNNVDIVEKTKWNSGNMFRSKGIKQSNQIGALSNTNYARICKQV